MWSLVEVLFFDPWKGAGSDFQAEWQIPRLGIVLFHLNNVKFPFVVFPNPHVQRCLALLVL